MTSVAAQFMLESEWVMATIGALTVMFPALAWFVKALVNQSESRIENSIGKVAQQVTDLAERVGRLEHQVDDTIIPKQQRIIRKLDAEDD